MENQQELDTRTVVERSCTAWAENDMETVFSLMHPDIVWVGHGFSHTEGLEAMKAFMADTPQDLQNTFSYHELIVADNRGVSTGKMQMYKEGKLVYEGTFCDIVTVENSLITRLESFMVETTPGKDHTPSALASEEAVA